jgi:hypothetical protein
MKPHFVILLTFLLTFLLFFQFQLNAQEITQTVKGKIIDIDTQSALPGATIILINSEPVLAASSDENGNFHLENVPIGRQSFKIAYIGYEDVFLNEILVSSGKEVIVNISMQESVENIEEVVITGNDDKTEAINSMAVISSMQITVESTSRIAAGVNDPSRTAQSFAGVSAADDEGNELVIRGNSPRGMLWRMEGVEIPNPNHFSNGEGSSGGGVSALSTMVLANSDFFTSAFPAEYGNALSGVFDLNLRNGNSEKREYALQIGFLGAQAALEGPFKKNSESSYLLNYRYSTLQLIDKMGLNFTQSTVVPQWQDLSFKFYFPTKNLGRFSFWGLGGTSTAGDAAKRDTASWEYRSDHFEENEYHTIGIIGLTHNYLFKNRKTYIKTTASSSYTNDLLERDTLNNDFDAFTIADNTFSYTSLIINSFLNHKFNPKNIIRVGATYHYKNFDFKSYEYNFNLELSEKLIDDAGNTDLYESYVQWKHRMNTQIDINSGIHFTYLSLNKDYALEPRLGIKWSPNKLNSIKFGAGLHSKPEPVSIYLAEKIELNGSVIMPNLDLKVTKAVHLVLGYNRNFINDWRINTEIYYQHLYDVPVQLDDTTGTISALNFGSGYTNEDFVNKGTGRNYGIELTLEKFFSNDWYGLATASIFESKYTMPDGIERNTLFNSKYIFNLVGGKEFKVGRNKQNILGANIRMMWRGGYRVIPVDIDASRIEDKTVRIYEQAFEQKTSDYLRADIGLSYKRNKPNWSWTFSLDIQNVTNHYNIWDQYYSSEKNEMVEIQMAGIIPILNFKVEF